jgi:hypothetical protein
MNAIILKGAALRQPPLPQSGPRAKTIAHPCIRVKMYTQPLWNILGHITPLIRKGYQENEKTLMLNILLRAL